MEFCQLTASIGPGSPTLRRKGGLGGPGSPTLRRKGGLGVAKQSRKVEASSHAKTHTAGHSNILITLATLVGSLIINGSPFECAEFAGRMSL